MEQGLGFAHFLTQTDDVGKVVLGALLLLSTASWYLIITCALANTLAQRRADAFLENFLQARSLADVRRILTSEPADNVFTRLVQCASDAGAESERQGVQSLALAGGMAEYITRVLSNEVDQEATRIDYGLTILASAGSAAPYVGLFGTVWGIYHALLQIGMSGQGTLDKVAGPVGEALIMTALGLAVAIPAVLAYNAFNRRNRMWLSRLESFAHDLYVLLTVKAGNGLVAPERT